MLQCPRIPPSVEQPPVRGLYGSWRRQQARSERPVDHHVQPDRPVLPIPAQQAQLVERAQDLFLDIELVKSPELAQHPHRYVHAFRQHRQLSCPLRQARSRRQLIRKFKSDLDRSCHGSIAGLGVPAIETQDALALQQRCGKRNALCQRAASAPLFLPQARRGEVNQQGPAAQALREVSQLRTHVRVDDKTAAEHGHGLVRCHLVDGNLGPGLSSDLLDEHAVAGGDQQTRSLQPHEGRDVFLPPDIVDDEQTALAAERLGQGGGHFHRPVDAGLRASDHRMQVAQPARKVGRLAQRYPQQAVAIGFDELDTMAGQQREGGLAEPAGALD